MRSHHISSALNSLIPAVAPERLTVQHGIYFSVKSTMPQAGQHRAQVLTIQELSLVLQWSNQRYDVQTSMESDPFIYVLSNKESLKVYIYVFTMTRLTMFFDLILTDYYPFLLLCCCYFSSCSYSLISFSLFFHTCPVSSSQTKQTCSILIYRSNHLCSGIKMTLDQFSERAQNPKGRTQSLRLKQKR